MQKEGELLGVGSFALFVVRTIPAFIMALEEIKTAVSLATSSMEIARGPLSLGRRRKSAACRVV